MAKKISDKGKQRREKLGNILAEYLVEKLTNNGAGGKRHTNALIA